MSEGIPLFDSHCHLDHEIFTADRQKVINHCAELGVSQILVPATTCNSFAPILQLAVEYIASGVTIYPALGLHPLFWRQWQPQQDLQQLQQYLQRNGVYAVGEIGLDFWRKDGSEQLQLQILQQQLTLAAEFALPVIVHNRKGHNQFLQMVATSGVQCGVMHAFSGSPELALAYRAKGFVLGIGGVVTYPNAHKLHQVVRQLPLEAFVLETDSPDMGLYTDRQKRNSPENIPRIAEAVATLKNISIQEVAEVTTATMNRVLAL